jgi:hypothetical protein
MRDEPVPLDRLLAPPEPAEDPAREPRGGNSAAEVVAA